MVAYLLTILNLIDRLERLAMNARDQLGRMMVGNAPIIIHALDRLAAGDLVTPDTKRSLNGLADDLDRLLKLVRDEE